MVPAGGDIKDSIEGCGLAGAGKHGSHASLKRADFPCYRVAGGVLQAGIKIPFRLQVKELAHVFGGIVLECGTLENGYLPAFPVAGSITCLDAQGFRVEFLVHNQSPQKSFCIL